MCYNRLMQTQAYLSTAEAAVKLGVSTQRVRALLAQKRIVGAVKVGRDWIIPTPPHVLTPRQVLD